jgi:hypothetical protein
MEASARDPDVHQFAIAHIGKCLAIRGYPAPALPPCYDLLHGRPQNIRSSVPEAWPTWRDGRMSTCCQGAAHVRSFAAGFDARDGIVLLPADFVAATAERSVDAASEPTP